MLWVQLQPWEPFSAEKAGRKHCSKRIPKVLNYLSTKAFTMDALMLLSSTPSPPPGSHIGPHLCKHFPIHLENFTMWPEEPAAFLSLGGAEGQCGAEPRAQPLAGRPVLPLMACLFGAPAAASRSLPSRGASSAPTGAVAALVFLSMRMPLPPQVPVWLSLSLSPQSAA